LRAAVFVAVVAAAMIAALAAVALARDNPPPPASCVTASPNLVLELRHGIAEQQLNPAF
jgi:hypothetical protein